MLAVVFFGGLFLQAVPAAAPLVEAQALLGQGKLTDAETAVRGYLETNRDSADAHYLLAYILFREQNPKASIEEYTAGARYRAPGALELKVVGCDYFLMEDYNNADKWLTDSSKLNPRDAITRYFLGRSKYSEKHFDEAVSAFTECLRLDPKNVGAADNLGLAYEGLGKVEEAIEAYKSAIGAAHGADAKPYFDLGTLLMENGKTQDALPFLVQAGRIKPGDAAAHRELGKAYLELNHLPEAQAELEIAVKLTPENGPTHFLLARVFRKRGMEDQARVETEWYSALTGAHSSPDTPLQESRSLLEQGKLPEAEQIVRRYLEIHKSSADAHFLLGYILFKEQNAKSSIAEYTEGAHYRAPTAADLEAVASDFELLKDYPDADKWFTKAVERNPKDALGWYYLGRTKYNENRPGEAIAAFEQCLKLEPDNAPVHFMLSQVYRGQGLLDKAKMESDRYAALTETKSGPVN